ncbi:choline ABC transporter substrate-binding protein [Phyllobacterium sp. YR531]|uniref:choline ABC transporter substrate-binding protein n=1 Tax=Phyllobacterium sp. YR531 TaxID=1144343 RepID=UPI00026FC413|nr:choline ABC transporter substrate-binding protein [Phyllobacterium sp. YR531]EJM99440.1 choline ABC transporter, periplasmic binding protein [Phyllobacterium sp. YR531]
MRKYASIALLAALISSHAELAAAEDAACKTIKAADLGWTDITLTTATATSILGAIGYEMKSSLLGLSVTYASLKDSQVDVFMGNWRPAQNIEFKPFFDNKWVDVLTTNLTGAKYTLAVPDYVAAEGVKSFDDLAKHPDKFARKIYGIEPGTNQPLLDMVAKGSHGLSGWTIVESSEQAMLAQVKRAVDRKEWVVFLGWQPHPMNLNLKMEYLTGGDEEFGPNFGGSTVWTLTRPGYEQACPNVAKFFKNLVFSVDQENEGMKMMLDDGATGEEAALAMIRKNPENLDKWLDGITSADGSPALEKVKAELLK